MPTDKASLRLKIYNGARRPFDERQSVLLRIHSGERMQAFTKILNTKSMNEGEVILNVDFFDNFADNYTVLISADGYRDSGFFPVKVSPRKIQELSLMLVPAEASFEFDPWDSACISHSKITQFLSLSAPSEKARDNYEGNIESRPTEMACLLNLATAMSQIFLPDATALDYFRAIEWDTLAADRFFGYAIPGLLSQIKQAVPKKLFRPELDPSSFHGDATSSFKEIRLGEANVQMTFHEKSSKKIDGDSCVRVEPDIDLLQRHWRARDIRSDVQPLNEFADGP
jgi:hypothetical protein